MMVLLGIVCTLLIVFGFILGFFSILGDQVSTLIVGVLMMVAGISGIIYGVMV